MATDDGQQKTAEEYDRQARARLAADQARAQMIDRQRAAKVREREAEARRNGNGR